MNKSSYTVNILNANLKHSFLLELLIVMCWLNFFILCFTVVSSALESCRKSAVQKYYYYHCHCHCYCHCHRHRYCYWLGRFQWSKIIKDYMGWGFKNVAVDGISQKQEINLLVRRECKAGFLGKLRLDNFHDVL